MSWRSKTFGYVLQKVLLRRCYSHLFFYFSICFEELETYSNVVSTFRAQGGLSDVKIKLLEELRNVFHISTDRHRAEARRVANDEQLCTIAET